MIRFSSNNLSSIINKVDSNSFTNLTTEATSSLAQTLSRISSSIFIEANNFNVTLPLSHTTQEEEEAEEIREEISPTTQVQPSSAVLVKKMGRPADSPGTKLMEKLVKKP